jgi:hypothetical protein
LREAENGQKHQRHDADKNRHAPNFMRDNAVNAVAQGFRRRPADVATRWWMAAMRA